MAPRHLLPSTAPRNPNTPPDASDPCGPCPRCGAVSNFDVVAGAEVTYKAGSYAANRDGSYDRIASEMVHVLECQGCRQRVVVVGELAHDGVPERLGAKSGRISWVGLHWWPPPNSSALDPSVPEAIREAYLEGLRCQAVKAYNAAGVMFRRTLEGIIDDKGSPAAKVILASRGPGKIAKAIKQMSADGDLTRELADWANDIREVGNDGGHWDPGDQVTVDDAQALAGLIGGLFDYLFILPAKLSARRGGVS